MTALLAIETATEACSAALWYQGIIISRYQFAPQMHAKLILPMCESLLNEVNLSPDQLSAVAFGRGPGSFTGIRIAAAIAQGIAIAHDLPLIAISSLQALAQTAYDQSETSSILSILTAIDARKNEVYWGQFEIIEGLATLINQEIVSAVCQLPLPKDSGTYLGAGSGWQNYHEDFKQHFNIASIQVIADIYPNAAAIAKLAKKAYDRHDFVNAENAIPHYLRNNIV